MLIIQSVIFLALPWKQLVTIGGMSLGNQLSSNVEITNLIDSGFEQCNGVPEYPLQADETNVQWIATKLLSCGGLIQYEGSNFPMPSDRCYVFDRYYFHLLSIVCLPLLPQG